MLKTLTAYTTEIDNSATAVQEILDQLRPAEQLRSNSVGIIACHSEFVDSGAAKTICDSLPFDVVGTITTVQATGDAIGMLHLSLMVLTSDDLTFKVARTGSIIDQTTAAIEQAYQEAAAAQSSDPALLFMFGPYRADKFGDDYVNTLTRLSHGAPCFGTLAVDDTPGFQKSYMLYNGEPYRDALSLILIYGALQPKFYIATISPDKLINHPALITSADCHIIKEINHRPVTEYFQNLGLIPANIEGYTYAMASCPFVLDYGDGTPPVSKVFIGLNEEHHAICAGITPEGSTIYLGIAEKTDTLLTTRAAVQAALQDAAGASGILVYSCISRYMALGSDFFAEIELVRDEIAGRLPFMMNYSGGEACPTQIKDNVSVNRFHNNAFILCLF
ncbi:MAG: FIST C-terminal domain-containing protein [Peptococcaceae bacterium]|jgi:hypothetical protein|nr:FIST C-terminal domain-containing protein [Peptococcaceae bacterium]